MAEQLQGLLERIQKDGIEKAEAEAKRIVEEAKATAAALLSEADAKAKASLEQAENDGKEFAERGRVALEQAARDVVISVGESITRTFEHVVGTHVRESLDNETLSGLIAQVVESYSNSDSGSKHINVFLAEDQRQGVQELLLAKFADAVRKSVTISGDDSIISGFRVSIAGENIQHDFSEAAITDALCELLRPRIAQIVRDAVSSGSN